MQGIIPYANNTINKVTFPMICSVTLLPVYKIMISIKPAIIVVKVYMF